MVRMISQDENDLTAKARMLCDGEYDLGAWKDSFKLG